MKINLMVRRAWVGVLLFSVASCVAPTPQTAEDFFRQGAACWKQKDFDGALANYTKAIALNPKYAEAYAGRGFAYYEKAEYERAIADWEKAQELEPSLKNTFAMWLSMAQEELKKNRKQKGAY